MQCLCHKRKYSTNHMLRPEAVIHSAAFSRMCKVNRQFPIPFTAVVVTYLPVAKLNVAATGAYNGVGM